MGSQGRVSSFILSKIFSESKLTALSPLAIQLIELASEEETSVDQLVNIIKQDPGLTARLLKLANSAFWGLTQPVSTISRAITLLGFNRVRLMALTLSLRESFPLKKIGHMDFEKYWRECLYRASLAQKLASLTNQDPEQAFIAGLILEIGLLFLFSVLPKDVRDTFPGNELPIKQLLEWEKEHFGITHREISYKVLTSWKFPQEIVSCHRYPVPEDTSLLCQIVVLADEAVELFFGTRENFYSWYKKAEKLLGVSTKEINQVMSQVFEEIDEFARQLQISMNKERDILEIMEKANQAILRLNCQLEQQLKKVAVQVENIKEQQYEESVQVTLDAVAHEIRNPLMALAGFARRLSKVGKDNDKVKNYAEIIVNEASRLESILKDINSYLQPYEPKLEEIEFNAFLKEIASYWQTSLDAEKITISVELIDQPIKVRLDKDGIKKVFDRLIKNAVRNILPEKGEIKLSLEVKDNWVAACVSDTGSGYDEKTIKLLIEKPFADKTFNTGLGIPWIKKIIKAHKGKLHIESHLGQGSKICVLLPTKAP